MLQDKCNYRTLVPPSIRAGLKVMKDGVWREVLENKPSLDEAVLESWI